MSMSYEVIPWDEFYASGTHVGRWDSPEPAPELVEFVEGRTWPANARAIDLGCGTGSDAIYLARHGFEVCGVDISELAIDAARLKAEDVGVQVRFLHADVCQLPVEDGSQHLVGDGLCLHHFTREQWDDYAREVERILMPSGVLFVRGVSAKHRDVNVLREDWIAEVFGSRAFRVGPVTSYFWASDSGRQVPCVAVAIERL